MASDTISILDGSTFVVSNRAGDIEAGPDQPHGLFYQDTRFLSRWLLTVDGSEPSPLSTDDVDYFSAQFFLVPPTGTIYKNPYLSVVRKRYVGDGFHEDVTVFNHDSEPAEAELRLEAGSDFADLFEVKDALKKKGKTYREVRDGVGAGRGAAMVHGPLRTRQRDHELPGPAVRARAGRDDAAAAREAPGDEGGSLPRGGAGQAAARAPLRRADGLRRAAALALL